MLSTCPACPVNLLPCETDEVSAKLVSLGLPVYRGEMRKHLEEDLTGMLCTCPVEFLFHSTGVVKTLLS